MKNIIAVIILSILLISCSNAPKSQKDADPDSFTFVFMTDIHVKPELRAMEGFQMAIDHVNELNPDFVITGGDLVDDVLNASFGRADTLYKLYNKMTEGFNMPVYNTMGNHEHYGYAVTPKIDPDHPEYGNKMFEKRIGKRYRSFDHKGWHFMILDGTEEGEDGRPYIGKVDEKQLEWIQEDLQKLDPETPIAIVTHIPLVSVFPQIQHGPIHAVNPGSLVTNQQDVLALFREMNLKLVLQGHLHAVEEINLMGKVRFITGGAICGIWWRTPDDGELQEGYVKVDVSGDDFSWEYVDYGWETGVTAN